ncbi:hypothetical protein [Chamaesiphon sp. VAR_48_metabat_135_sub]|uniref:hypothetical protein n=1 Tax=Chamaesiphon sp. VAR_48_metabat_135_sub TaxID=2964699 RepID=UPI00286D5ADD|nr:hypothetical protein [Chamaesiphon sp. VAR_48_metabat_135_sub]
MNAEGQNIKTIKWSKIGILTPILLIAALGVNETLLKQAKHQPSVVSDADLFCDVYTRVRDLGSEDVVFLGASRMQAGLDLATFYDRYPNKKAVLLAQSGKGSSYPVFQNIVDKTNYRGIAIIDETEGTLSSQNNDQLPFVNHCYDSFSINRQLNRSMSTWLQSHFVFLNPQSSSLRLWGNLASQRKLPVPFYTKTLSDRQQLTDYARADPKALQTLHAGRLKDIQNGAQEPSAPFETWFAQTKHWQPLIEKFQQRGGKVIFVRMPVAEDRWKFERKIYPPDRYWQPWMNQFKLKSVHFANYPDLATFQLADTSHLDMRDKAAFTKIWLTHLQAQLPSLSATKPK